MSIFDAYDQEFTTLSQEIERNVGELKAQSGPSEKTTSLIKMIDALFSQSNDLVKQMEVEVRSNDPGTRKVLMEKVNILKKSSTRAKGDYEREKEKAERSSLIGSKSHSDRQRLLDVNDRLESQNEMIANAHRTVAETEEVGLEITQELNRNRDKLVSARAKASDFSGVSDSARKVLNAMARRDVRQRWLVVFIVVVLIISFSLAIYYGTRSK